MMQRGGPVPEIIPFEPDPYNNGVGIAYENSTIKETKV